MGSVNVVHAVFAYVKSNNHKLKIFLKYVHAWFACDTNFVISTVLYCNCALTFFALPHGVNTAVVSWSEKKQNNNKLLRMAIQTYHIHVGTRQHTMASKEMTI